MAIYPSEMVFVNTEARPFRTTRLPHHHLWVTFALAPLRTLACATVFKFWEVIGNSEVMNFHGILINHDFP
jgi:hypothetical protein